MRFSAQIYAKRIRADDRVPVAIVTLRKNVASSLSHSYLKITSSGSGTSSRTIEAFASCFGISRLVKNSLLYWLEDVETSRTTRSRLWFFVPIGRRIWVGSQALE